MENVNKINWEAIRSTIGELLTLCKETSDPSLLYLNYLHTVFGATAGLLTAPANALYTLITGPIEYSGLLVMNISDELPSKNLLTAIHRIYLSDLHSTTEQALRIICAEHKISPTSRKMNKLDSYFEESNVPIDDTSRTNIAKLVGRNLSLNDYMEAAFKMTSLTKKEKAFWRNYMSAFGIIRNNVSHSPRQLTSAEAHKLIGSGFHEYVHNNELVMNVSMYTLLGRQLIIFLNGIVYSLPRVST